MNDITLSQEQRDAVDAIYQWYKYRPHEKTFVLAGYAGTGKTTLAKRIAQIINDENASLINYNQDVEWQMVRFCAFTGKAANVLREKGCAQTSTIHGALYDVGGPLKKKIQELEQRLRSTTDETTKKAIKAELRDLRKKAKKPRFYLNEDAPIKNSPLVIVDEYSMLNTKLVNDLETVAKRVLYLGDPFQLPPVGGECKIKPTLFLEQIHRQALDSPILRYATKVRNGDTIDFCNEGDFIYGKKADFSKDTYLGADQVIVGRNSTRKIFNSKFRNLLGFKESKWPLAGEKLICLRNNHEANLFNGLILRTVDDAELVDHDSFTVNFEGYTGVPVWTGDIQNRANDFDTFDKKIAALERFDYAYAITCHKSQGSEFDNVVIFNQPVGNNDTEHRRWLYTALTRGKKSVTLIEP